MIYIICPNCGFENSRDVSNCHNCSFSLENHKLQKIRCILSKANLKHNLNLIKDKAPKSNILAIVKANAYGHGIIPVSKHLEVFAKELDLKQFGLGVASVYEAMKLRRAGVDLDITLLKGVLEPNELTLSSKYRFTVVFHNNLQIRWLNEMTKEKMPKKIKSWLKVDTGLGRFGFSEKPPFYAAMKSLSDSLFIDKPIGVMSTLACAAKGPNYIKNKEQMDMFKDFVQGYQGPKSICNSAAIFDFDVEEHFDWVRPGLALYGISPFAKRTAEKLELKPVMTFETELIEIHNSAETFGYCPICKKNQRLSGIAC